MKRTRFTEERIIGDAVGKERQACRVTGSGLKSMGYPSQRDDDAEVRSKLRELAQQRRSLSYAGPAGVRLGLATAEWHSVRGWVAQTVCHV